MKVFQLKIWDDSCSSIIYGTYSSMEKLELAFSKILNKYAEHLTPTDDDMTCSVVFYIYAYDVDGQRGTDGCVTEIYYDCHDSLIKLIKDGGDYVS